MLNKIMQLQNSIANDVWPNGSKLTCEECGLVIIATTDECAEYLANGWPTHHGKSMLLEIIEE